MSYPAGTSGEPVLRAIQLNKAYYLGETIYAVNDVSLAVQPGQFVVIAGPSGSGKTTLLSLLGGLDRPISGEVVLDGHRYSRLNENGLALLRRRRIGFVFQFFNLINHLTALENVMLPLRFATLSGADIQARAKELLDAVGLAGRVHHRPLQLSGGEQQRVAIARALANRPSVVLADEPTGNLDSRARQQIAGLFRRFNQENGQTFVVVSHDDGLVSEADVVYRISDGRIVDRVIQRGDGA